MPNEVSIYEPRTMAKVIHRMPPVRTFFRSTFFKKVNIFPTKSIDVDLKKGSRKLAPFVNPRVGGKTIPNTGYQTETYTPPLLAPNKITTVDDLMERMPGEGLYSGRTPAERAVEKMAEDFTELRDMNIRREEWMCAKAFFTGKIPIVGEGVNEEIDFNFTNKEVITTAAKKWTADTSDPIADIKRWRKEVQKTGYVNCDICVMADDLADIFINHKKVKELLDVKGYDLAVIKPRELPNGVTYIGTLKGLSLDIYSYNEWYMDDWTDPDNPALAPLVPDGHLALLSTAANYSLNYGAVTLLDNKTEKFLTVEAQMVPETWVERRPSRRFFQLNSKPLPVPHEVDSWFVAQPI